MRVCKMAGVQLMLNNWFLALIVIFTLAGMASKVLIVFSAVLWHELSHAAIAYMLGFKVREIELLPFGGVARIERLGEAGAKSEMMIAAAGPVASLVLAAVCYLGMSHNLGMGELLSFYFNINMMLAAFNLTPGLPLDGGRMLRAWLALSLGYGHATWIVVRLSKFISLLLVMVAFYNYLHSSTINLTFIVAAIILYVAAKAESRLAGFRTMRILANKKAELKARGLMPASHFTIMATTPVRDIIRLLEPDKYYVILVVDEALRIQGTLTETELWEGLPSHGMCTQIGKFLQ